MQDVYARLLSRVVRTKGCWEWPGSKDGDGYGTIRDGVRLRKTHRVMWEAVHGAIPEGLSVLHRCDNPPCVRPDHLFLGTNAVNQGDRRRKGRSPMGIRNGRAKLTNAQVLVIRERYDRGGVSQQSLADEYGVTQVMISKVVRRVAWSHVTQNS